ncbi:MAG: CZB domain-containing protein [SAR324 cluster bacterium]|nr:CZB domain-containing protein [SAR324 cluster bacterium]
MKITDGKEIADQINLAVGIHGLWKSRITDAINTGKSEWEPAFVTPCGNCDFGKWLDGLDEENKTEEFQKVYAIHSDFHKEAGRILAMALDGKKSDAEAAVDEGSEYQKLTSSLTLAMMGWKRAAA